MSRTKKWDGRPSRAECHERTLFWVRTVVQNRGAHPDPDPKGEAMMKTLRVSVVAAVAMAGSVIASTAAQASVGIQRPFAADSGDACGYGSTEGVLTWQYGLFTSPLPLTSVAVRGTVTDRPTPADPGFACRDDGYFSRATFTAYSGTAIVAEKEAKADNAAVGFEFTLAPPVTAGQITRIVVQVCRDPLVTLPPSYCGKAVQYDAPPVAAP
jgi:hypothetical protein